jgi:gas vesicle protein
MSEQRPGAMVHEMLGRFIEEAVNRAVQDQINKMADLAEQRAEEVVAAGTAKWSQTLDRATSDIQKRIHHMVEHMVEQGLSTLTTEAERLVERNTQSMQEISRKSLDDIPVTIQESLMQMSLENEAMFRGRAMEWMSQLCAEQTAEMSLVLQAQFEAVRRSMLEEVAQSARAICDRNLFDIRSDFENHVNRSFQNMAERLTAPFTRQ